MPRLREPDYSVRWMATNAPLELQRELTDAYGKAVLAYSKEEAPVGEGPNRGELKNSGLYSDGRVRFTADHAGFVHEGTRPHMIYPKRPGGVLSWERGGVRRFARKVHHPGTKPNPFLKRGMQRAHAEAAQIGQPIMDRWLSRNRVR